MKKVTDGKRYSRRERKIYEGDDPAWKDELKRTSRKNVSEKGNVSYSGGMSLAVVKASRDRALSYLAAKDERIPASTVVRRWEGARNWSGDYFPHDAKKREMKCIHKYVESLDYERDSIMDLAARMAMHSDRILVAAEKGMINSLVDEAIQLGQVQTLIRVYGSEGENGRKGGGKPKKRAWALEIADFLKKECDGTKEDRWEHLSMATGELEAPFGDLEFYVDGNTLVCKIDNGPEETLKKSTFLKRYL